MSANDRHLMPDVALTIEALRREVAALRAERDEARRMTKALDKGWTHWKAEVERMRPIVDAAIALFADGVVLRWHDLPQLDALLERVAAYRATSTQEATDA